MKSSMFMPAADSKDAVFSKIKISLSEWRQNPNIAFDNALKNAVKNKPTTFIEITLEEGVLFPKPLSSKLESFYSFEKVARSVLGSWGITGDEDSLSNIGVFMHAKEVSIYRQGLSQIKETGAVFEKAQASVQKTFEEFTQKNKK